MVKNDQKFDQNFMEKPKKITFWDIKFLEYTKTNTAGSPILSTIPYRTVAYRTVPYRFPRETVLVDRAAYRTFLTVFRDFS